MVRSRPLSFCSFAYGRSRLDNPTPKFGEALRAQVEERLAFFETGAQPSKNADAIRRVLDNLALDDDSDDEDEEDATQRRNGDVEMEDMEPVLPLIEASPPPKKSKHKDKEKKKAKGKEKEGAKGKEKEQATEKDRDAMNQKKRRSSEAMNVDGESDAEEDEDEPPVKKIKLSKEEKKALKKAVKAAKKAEKAAEGATEVCSRRIW